MVGFTRKRASDRAPLKALNDEAASAICWSADQNLVRTRKGREDNRLERQE
jgi:hypothetical protein